MASKIPNNQYLHVYVFNWPWIECMIHHLVNSKSPLDRSRRFKDPCLISFLPTAPNHAKSVDVPSGWVGGGEVKLQSFLLVSQTLRVILAFARGRGGKRSNSDCGVWNSCLSGTSPGTRSKPRVQGKSSFMSVAYEWYMHMNEEKKCFCLLPLMIPFNRS